MPISSNRYFNDPALGQGFANLAQLFAPPSGGDLAGYASAAAKKEEAARLAELFNYAKDPNVQQGVFDRLGQATGQWTPSTGYYGVDTNAATVRRGQDIDARTSIFNNSADNARALEDRRLQEAAAMERLGITDATSRRGQDIDANTALARQRLANEGELAKLFATPVTVGENATVYVPGQTAEAAGLPRALTGQTSVGQGETVYRADGSTLQGQAKPLSETEVKAAERQRLAQSGQLTDQMLIDSIVGERTPVQAVGPDGKTPVYMSPGAAISNGAQPYINKGAEAKPQNYQAPDGRRGTAVVGPDGRMVDTQTSQPIPEGSVTFGTNIQGSEADTGMSTKTNQTRSVQIRGNVTNMNGLLTELETLVANNPAVTGLAGNLLSFTQDAKQVVSEFSQKFGGDPNMPVTPDQLRDVMNSVLPETGNYNPVYRKAAALVFELAYANAKLNNPGGEVSRFALERELEQLGQGLVGNDKALMAVIDVSKGRMKRALDEAAVLDGSSAGVTADQIGRQPTTVVRKKFDANGDPVQ